MIDSLRFFQKVECEPDFLKKYFDNFVAMYGLIIPMEPVISKISISQPKDVIEYRLHLTQAIKVNIDILNQFIGTSIQLYGHNYLVNANLVDSDLVLSLTE